MFTEIEVANQWYCRTHNDLCPTLHKRTCAFCLWSSLWAVDQGSNEQKMVKERREEICTFLSQNAERPLSVNKIKHVDYTESYIVHWFV